MSLARRMDEEAVPPRDKHTILQAGGHDSSAGARAIKQVNTAVALLEVGAGAGGAPRRAAGSPSWG